MKDEQIKEVMRLADEIADYAWKQGLSDGAYSQADHDRKSCDASRAALEAYLRTIGDPENTFPLNPNAASKWAHLQKHDGAEAIGVVFRTGSGSVGSLVDGRVVWADWLAHPNGSKPESVNAELLEALKGMALSWGSGFSGGESPSLDRARAAIARAESAMPFWPNHPSAISDPLFHQARGIMGTENFGQEEALRLAILHVLNARAESAIESSPKPATFPAMKAAFRTTRVEAGEFIMAFKFRDIEDMDRADDEWRAAMVIETPAKVSPCAGHAVQQDADASRDWPEDFPHENGQYMNTCHVCKNTFIGHKHRVVCKVCKVRNNGFIRAQQEADEAGGA